MSEDAGRIAREAKGLQQGLKESLKTRDPWDREIEFQRNNLRRQYLRLLFVHPYVAECKDAEGHLWMNTSYAFISIYKQRITTLDRTLFGSSPRQQAPRQGGHGVVEYRKLLQRFRQFLAEEEKFWTQVVIRIRRCFALDEAQQTLVLLGLIPAEPAPAGTPETAPPKRNNFHFPPEADTVSPLPPTSDQRESQFAILGKALVCLGDIARYKELYNEAGGRPRAGHEDGPPAVAPASKNGRSRKIGPATGPIAELMMLPRLRNYEKAHSCYEQARKLLPYDGNSSHQMAILASYQKDVFNSLYHYYRALCVRQPYDTALENLTTVLSKALDQWKARGAKREKEREKDEARGTSVSLAPRLRVEAFKEKLIVLHAQWRLLVDESELPNLSDKVLNDFKALVSERVLPEDMISKVIVLAQGAMWRHRAIRLPQALPTNGSKKPGSMSSPAVTESHIASHVLTLYRILLDIGSVQIAEKPPEDAAENDLAQRITAIFRRTLPALRMSGKWVRANLPYILNGHQQAMENGKRETSGPPRNFADKDGAKEKTRSKTRVSIKEVPAFWISYAQFLNALLQSFPLDKLPGMNAPLEEDTEMTGFLPLHHFMMEDVKGAMAGKGNATVGESTSVVKSPHKKAFRREEGHPNEEQLMRIADLLRDAEALCTDGDSPITFNDNQFILKGIDADISIVQTESISSGFRDASDHPQVPQSDLLSMIQQKDIQQLGRPDDDDDDADVVTIASRTDDDPVAAAFRQVLEDPSIEEDGEQEDEIVWDPRASVSPRDHLISALPSSPVPLHMSPVSFGPIARDTVVALMSPKTPKTINELPPGTTITGTTAQDLLNNVMGMQRRPNNGRQNHISHVRESSAPQAQLLFGGSGPANGPMHSIWSTSLDGDALKYQRNMGLTNGSYNTSPPQPFPQGLSQGPWPSYPNSQSSQVYLPGSFPSPPGAPQSHPVVSHGHQRLQSTSMAHSHSAPGRSQGLLSPSLSQTPALFNQSVSSLYRDPISTSGNLPYYRQNLGEYPNYSMPYQHDPRLGPGYPVPDAPLFPASQIWGNVG